MFRRGKRESKFNLEGAHAQTQTHLSHCKGAVVVHHLTLNHWPVVAGPPMSPLYQAPHKHIHTQTNTHTYMHTHTHIRPHTDKEARTHMRTYKYTHVNTNTYKHTHTSHTHVCTHVCTHASANLWKTHAHEYKTLYSTFWIDFAHHWKQFSTMDSSTRKSRIFAPSVGQQW